MEQTTAQEDAWVSVRDAKAKQHAKGVCGRTVADVVDDQAGKEDDAATLVLGQRGGGHSRCAIQLVNETPQARVGGALADEHLLRELERVGRKHAQQVAGAVQLLGVDVEGVERVNDAHELEPGDPPSV
jgi:hypothetical protein